MFDESYDPTIEDCFTKNILYKEKIPVTIELIDTAGTEQFEAMRELYIKTGDAFILVYSIDNPGSLRETQLIYDQIIQQREKVCSY